MKKVIQLTISLLVTILAAKRSYMQGYLHQITAKSS